MKGNAGKFVIETVATPSGWRYQVFRQQVRREPICRLSDPFDTPGEALAAATEMVSERYFAEVGAAV